MSEQGPRAKNPCRVAAGRLNQQKCKGLTPRGRQRLRQAALANRPWRFATGPRTPQGKARCAANGRKGQKGPVSAREARAELKGLRDLLRQMQEARGLAGRA